MNFAKDKLRQIALKERKNYNTQELSRSIMLNLFNLPEYQQAKNILCYYPLKYEVSDMDCINDFSKNIFLPKVKESMLIVCPYDADKIKKGSYNIMEPQTEPIENNEIIDLIIIPALSADRKGYRLGYGKGYYDRFLKQNYKNAVKIVLCFHALFFNDIFPDKYDEKADIIVTEREVCRF